jgi:WD40 repeat protein
MADGTRETVASRGAAAPAVVDGGLGAGDVVAGYRIEARAGAGGMGVVYRAVEPALGRTVALKIVAPDGAHDSAEALIREARAAAALEHPNAVPVYRAGEDAGRVYIAMRFVEGESLHDRIGRDGRLPLAEVAPIVAQVADALDAAHALGFVHGDVKPGNVLLGDEAGGERAYLTDFGLALRAGAAGRPGAGTPAYLAPEQVRRLPLDGRADVYALGCLIVHCLTGRPPVPGEPGEAVIGHLTTAPPRPSALVPDLPPAVDAVVARALAKRPEDRHPTAGALAADLAAARFDLVLVHGPEEAGRADATRGELAAAGLDVQTLAADADGDAAARVLGAAAACAVLAGDAPGPAGPALAEAERRAGSGGLRLLRVRPGDGDAVASLARLARGPRAAPPGDGAARPPYRGLASFTERDADLFHGRDAEVAKALAALAETGFVAVVGASGSGKSSVLRAGILAALARDALPGSAAWDVAVMTPGAAPLRALAAAAPPGNAPDLLVVDALEEAFTLCADRGERAAFLDGVAAAAASGGRVAVAVRADFYGHLAEHPGMRALAERSQVLLGPLTADGLRAAVAEPAAAAGLELEPGLLRTILADVADRPGALPLLQHVLLELWERRRGGELTLEAYAAAGGVGGALARHADAVLAAMDDADRATARRVLLRLVRPGEGAEDTRRRADADELAVAGTPPEDLARVLAALTAGRLVTAGRDEASGRRVVDLAHEALIRGWPTLRGWIDEERDDLARRRVLADAAAEWDARGRDEELLLGPRRLAAWEGRDLGGLSDTERRFLEAGRARADAQARARRNRIRLALAGLSVAVIVISAVAVLALWQRGEANDARDRARDERAVAVSRQLAVEAARELPGDPQLGLLLARAAWESAPTPQAEVQLRQAALDSRAVAVLRSDGPIQEGILTPDGRSAVGIGEDGTVRVWDVASGDVVATTTLADESLESVAATPDGSRIAVSGGSGRVWLLELPALTRLGVTAIGRGATENVAWGPGGRLATAHEDGTAAVWRPPAREPLALLRGHGDRVRGVAWNRDGQVVTSSADGTVRVWDADGGPALRVLRGEGDLRSLAVAPDGGIAAGSTDFSVREWPAGGGPPRDRRGHSNEIYGVAVTPDGRWLASTGADGRLLVWDRRREGPPVLRLEGHRGYVYSASFDASGGTLATAGQDGTLRLWDVSPERMPTVLFGATKGTFGAEWSPGGDAVVTGSQDTRLRLWDAGGGPPRAFLDGSRNEIYGIDLSADGRHAAAADIDGGSRVWDVRTGRVLAWVNRDGGGDADVAFSPDGALLATAGFDTVVRVWDWRSGRLVRSLPGHSNLIWEVAFAPDGRTVASASVDATGRIWDWPSGRPRAVLRGHGTDVSSLEYRPDATEVATAGGDGTVRIWRVEDGRQVAVLSGHSDVVNQVRWAVDGRRLATVSVDDTARIWDRQTGATLAVVGLGADGTAVAAAPDGRRFLFADSRGVARIVACDVCGPPAEVAALARARAVRELTPEERARFLPQAG